jgi:hypothetical protein
MVRFGNGTHLFMEKVRAKMAASSKSYEPGEKEGYRQETDQSGDKSGGCDFITRASQERRAQRTERKVEKLSENG